MTATAIYRLPHQDTCTIVDGEGETLTSMTGLNNRSGFVVAPFAATTETPIVLIRPDRVEACPVSAVFNLHPSTLSVPPSTLHLQPSTSLSYDIDFANFHSQLTAGTFQKIVLARCVREDRGNLSPMELFVRACQQYPRLFVALVSTPQSGMWLTATPEVLLQSEESGQWRTIALAGTMKLEGRQLDFDTPKGKIELTWTTKNIQEQRVVATYITECLERHASDIREYGPRTARAGKLVHLRTDFTFTLPDNNHIGSLLADIHPTPAVCGLPKKLAADFILHNEHTPRSYYSGFMGPLAMGSTVQATDIYVSLRCMNICDDGCYLYAGGGLLADSDRQQEWAETEAKLETMRELLI
ncbi:MAG: chorismate-binding protein [Prevotella sp.]|nr:chorismate-binding protein [Prevotella sp.]